MKKKTFIALSFGMLTASFGSLAESNTTSTGLPSYLNGDLKVKASHRIKSNDLIMLELESGELLLATGDGKYLVKGGSIFSTVHTKYINSVKDFYESTKVDLSALNFDAEKDFVGFNINPDAEVFGGTLFVSQSNCDYCQAFIEQLEEEHPDKRFRAAVIPIFTEDDYRNTIRAQCSEKPDEALRALFYDQFDEMQFPKPVNDNCGEAVAQINATYTSLTMIATQQLGFPYFFNNGSESILGMPKSKAYLTEVIMRGID